MKTQNKQKQLEVVIGILNKGLPKNNMYMDWDDTLEDGTEVKGWVQGELHVKIDDEGKKYFSHIVFTDEEDSTKELYEVRGYID